MNLQKLSSLVSISDQLREEDIPELAALDVQLLVCNRPDGEAADQPSFTSICELAKKHGIEALHLPFSPGKMANSDVQQFKKILAGEKRVHAYCRTGNRSKSLFQASQNISELAPKENKKAFVNRFDVVIVGAGSAGIAVASSLKKRQKKLRIALVDPAKEHFYQPGWTMVGGGVFNAESTRRSMSDIIPAGVKWVNQAVKGFNCKSNNILLDDGQELNYGQLIVAPGLKLDWSAVEGLEESLGKNGVTSNYRFDLAPYTWRLVQELRHGRAVFTQAPMPIKCAGAPQKAMYLSADHWLKSGVLNNIDVGFYNAGGVLFGVKEYLPALESYVKKYRAELNFNSNLRKVDGENRCAWFDTLSAEGEKQQIKINFDMLHVCPPQCAPEFIQQSELADDSGWLDVNPATLQHANFDNVWGLGDVINAPNAKTMAAARKQAPVVAENVLAAMGGRAIHYAYDGYGSCPLTVEKGKIVLAEFAYGGRLTPSFPKWINDGTQPSYRAWFLKMALLPHVYWHGMLKGREWLAGPEKIAQV